MHTTVLNYLAYSMPLLIYYKLNTIHVLLVDKC